MMQRRIAATLGASPDAAADVAPLIQITTTGDRVQDRRLLEIVGKGLFTKEIEEALLDRRIDCAIHSLKDMPADSPPALVIGAIPEREDPRDVFISPRASSIAALRHGAALGTASLRRQAQALHIRPDLQLINLRGNVDTRLAKLDAGEADAIILAFAGLKRLGLGGIAATPIDPVEQPPAPGQGALAIQVREEDVDAPWLTSLIHHPSVLTVGAERGALTALEGSCKTAIGAHARLTGGRLQLIVEALTPDGVRRFRRAGEAEVGGPGGEAVARALGLRLGAEVAAEGGAALTLQA